MVNKNVCFILNLILYRPHAKQKATAESLSAMLVQGVQSGDKQLLKRVLTVKKDHLITGTVRNLSVSSVVPLLKTVSYQVPNPSMSQLTTPAVCPVISLAFGAAAGMP